MTDLIVFGILSFLVLVLLINSLRLQLKIKKLTNKFIQDTLDKAIIIGNLKKELASRSPDNIEKTEGFLKFISESRDWAFKYIEDVQAALATFKSKVEPQFKYAKTYGKAVGPSTHSTIIDEIALAYLDLKKVMPDDEEKDNKTK